ncbi:MAG: hypothetical protein H6531_00345 [Actinobacteria bacterium]|nr:hypothetical protein [Thermoleophilia bacterium]MCB9010265.1 hypothetical protein [Actinomycetota bacterium]
MPKRAILVALLAAALALVAGCGDSGTVTVTVTDATTTADTSSAGTVTAAPAIEADLELRLPPPKSIPSLRPGTATVQPTAQKLVDSLYSTGDAAKPAAVVRLDAAGYETGVLRDQRGANPRRGLTLFRSYVYRLRDQAAAQHEVDDSVDEVKRDSTASSVDVEVPDIPGARGLLLKTKSPTIDAEVLYVTWVAGRDVYGIQSFTRAGSKLYRDETIDLAQTLYLAWKEG